MPLNATAAVGAEPAVELDRSGGLQAQRVAQKEMVGEGEEVLGLEVLLVEDGSEPVLEPSRGVNER